MSRADFDDFIRRTTEKETIDLRFDPKKQLAEWLDYLDRLYKEIEGFLATYIMDKKTHVEYKQIHLNEDFSGPYEAKQLLLHIAKSVITFEPLGTMLIGSKGRVDVQGPRGRARLSLVDSKLTDARQLVRVHVSIDGKPPTPPPEPRPDKIEWAWKIITPPPEIRFIDLTEDSFFDMILGVTDA